MDWKAPLLRLSRPCAQQQQPGAHQGNQQAEQALHRGARAREGVTPRQLHAELQIE